MISSALADASQQQQHQHQHLSVESQPNSNNASPLSCQTGGNGGDGIAKLPMSSICGTASSSSSLLSTELSNQSIVYVNVGGQVFTTTKRTLRKSGLFLKLFTANSKQEEQQQQQQQQPSTAHELITASAGAGAGVTAPAEGVYGVYLCHSNYYFVDRSPLLFEDILHFLRNMPASSAETFLHRYYGASPLSLSRRSSYSMNSNASDCAVGIHGMRRTLSSRSRDLLKLQDEAVFYNIPALVEAIQDRLDEESKELHMASCKEVAACDVDTHSHSMTMQSRAPQYSISNSNLNSNLVAASRPSPLVLNSLNAMATLSESQRPPDLSWWDQSGPFNGLRRIEGTRIAFATSMDNWVDKHSRFEAPRGFKWATQSMYLAEYHAHRDILSAYKQWIHFGLGGWDNYRWKYARKVAFIFADTFRSQRFVHSGMEVCDINHVKSIFGLVAESPLMDWDDEKGIVEGFAGLVLLADEEWYPEQEQQQQQQVQQQVRVQLTLPENIEAVDSGDEKNENEDEDADVVVIDDDAASASTWSSVEETEEQLKGVILELSTEKRDFEIEISPNNDNDNENEKTNHSNSNDNESNDNSKVVSTVVTTTTSKSSSPGKNNNKAHPQVLESVKSKRVLSPAAVPYPALGAPKLANPFTELTKQRRDKLTKNNLEKHTRIESLKHRTQQKHQQQQQQSAPVRMQQHAHPQAQAHVQVGSPAHAMSPKSMARFAPKVGYATAVGSPTFFQPPSAAYHGHGGHAHPNQHGGVGGHGHAHSPMHMMARHSHSHSQMQFPARGPPPPHGHGHRLMYQTPPMMPVTNSHSFAPPPLGAHLSVNSLPNHQ